MNGNAQIVSYIASAVAAAGAWAIGGLFGRKLWDRAFGRRR